MTYIAGIRRGGRAYLVADSAISWSAPGRTPSLDLRQRSAFGEQHVIEQGRVVIESGVKIHRFGRIAIATAGDVECSTRLVASLRQRVNEGADESIRLVQATIDDFRGSLGECQFIGVITSDGRVDLFSFNIDGTQHFAIHTTDGIVQAGSLPLLGQELSRFMFSKISERIGPDQPASFLVAIIAWMQGLCLRDYLLDAHGIGGVFYGLWADEAGTHWQADVLFGIHSRMSGPVTPVTTVIRDGAVLARSGFMNGVTVGLYSTASARMSFEEWRQVWPSDKITKSIQVRYVVLIDSIQASVAVFELDEDSTSALVKVKGPVTTDLGDAYNVDIAENVRACLRLKHSTDSPLQQRVFLGWTSIDGHANNFTCLFEAKES